MNNCTSNSSSSAVDYASRLLPWQDVVLGVSLTIVDVFALILNGIVFTIFCTLRTKLHRHDLLILNLAISDISLPVFAYPLAIYSLFKHQWSFGNAGCIYYGFISFFAGVYSIGLLTAISISRYMKLCKTSNAELSVCKINCGVLGSVLYSLGCSLPPLFGWGEYGPDPHGTSCSLKWDSRSGGQVSYVATLVVVGYVAPLAIMSACYGCILRKVFAQKRIVNKKSRRLKKMDVMEIRLCKMSAAMGLGFMLAWTPYAIVSFWITFENAPSVPPLLTVISAILAKASHAYNPVIYFLMNRTVRDKIRTLFEMSAPQRQRIELRLSSNETLAYTRENTATCRLHGLLTCRHTSCRMALRTF
ncbi:visual pigment-like receptor peropsin [Lingula anatina]|uniref:Visual pigment-like receptor peropsin n=1 Tax=Lingula anatina TaxID=7574 RepID=A0A1S3K9Z2_LINAN|nr:visual pigment-like receptor peropsin [Lingula anatina]XP_013419318.1 visual pigment-like receptor peropsin [Lingula anatina]XP_013419319.1 visual pigment-like receptor peropsin [Lingula anatina]|eukprot:XP_013419317.1 visual pigment-like receptor peropsin [Lingula anatina]